MRVNRNVTILLVIFMFYWGFVPAFWSWMPPHANTQVPSEWDHTKDMPLTIIVTSWHSNFKVTGVRFYIDNQLTRLEGIDQPLYPLFLLQEPPVRMWNRLTLNRFTFPRVRKIELNVPLSSLASEGKINRGVLAGKVDIVIDSVGSVDEYSGLGMTELNWKNSDHIPFQISLR
jgi:hypothetical protein